MNERKNALLLSTFALCLLVLAISGPVGRSWAQAPVPSDALDPQVLVGPLLQYQARLTSVSTGEPLSGTYTISFRLYNTAVGGSWLWEESKDVPVVGGLLTVVLGDVTPIDAALFNGQALWLGIRVNPDAEATPRQQLLPAAYALGLVPGLVLSTTSPAPALNVRNFGSGDAIRVDGNLNVTGNLVGGTHNHDSLYYPKATSDSRYVNTTGPDSILGKDASPALTVGQSGTGIGGYFTSTSTYGARGDTSSTANEQAGLLGVAGWTGTALNNYAGVLGKSSSGLGVAGVSDNGYGVYGTSSLNYGVYGTSVSSNGVRGESSATSSNFAGVYGRSASGAAGVYGQTSTTAPGVLASSSAGWGLFASGGAGAIYANGNSTVNGVLTTQAVAYSSPRTHYYSLPGEAFVQNGTNWFNTAGIGGACTNAGGPMVAPVNLPHGSIVTNFTVYFRRNHGASPPTVTVNFDRLFVSTGGYGVVASVTSAQPGYVYDGYSTDWGNYTVAAGHTVDNSTTGYLIYAYWPSGSCDIAVMGVRITYTVAVAE